MMVIFRIENIKRKTAVLSPSSIQCLSKISTINLSAGCAHGCLYCYTQGYSIYPGNGVVQIYDSLPEQLEEELLHKKHFPKRVYFSPSSDLFQPIPQILENTCKILRLLLERGIEVAFLTKGKIPEGAWAIFEKYSSLVYAQIGLITINEEIRNIFEPFTATVSERISQIQRLTDLNIYTSVRLDPIIPCLTDSSEDFDTLCNLVAKSGVTSLAASVLFLRQSLFRVMKSRLNCISIRPELKNRISQLFEIYKQAEKMLIHAQNSSVKAAPISLREEIFARLRQATIKHGLELHICSCKNPDISSDSCRIAGTSSQIEVQPSLF